MGRKSMVLLVMVLTLFLTEEKVKGSITEEMMFSNKGYAKNIDMETYLISEDKLAQVLSSHWEQKMPQETHRELYGKNVYLVIRVRNKGDLAAWGMLACRINGGNLKVYIDTVPFDRWFNYLVPRGVFTSKRDGSIPAIETKWETLYAK